MPRSKEEAQLRLSIGMARVLMQEGKSASESLAAFREHFEVLEGLKSSQKVEVNQETTEVTVRQVQLSVPR